jgi:predicted nucleic-acid-binding protein
MIAVDTNIIVRILAADDPRQAKRAVAFKSLIKKSNKIGAIEVIEP